MHLWRQSLLMKIEENVLLRVQMELSTNSDAVQYKPVAADTDPQTNYPRRTVKKEGGEGKERKGRGSGALVRNWSVRLKERSSNSRLS